jgi:uncharacterized protein (DUF1800 family)
MNLRNIDPDWAWQTWQSSNDQVWDSRLATHFYRRAAFGASATTLQASIQTTPTAILDGWLSNDDAALNAFDDESTAVASSVLAGGDPKQLASWWLYRMQQSPNPLLEKATLLWHGHFATSAEKVEDVRLMFEQNQLLRKNALGDFAAMAHGISRDPAMLVYLDSVTNRKSHPNENFARELMELFCLGEGNYSETDIRELAKCFTGWEIRRKRFRFNRYQHDFGEKQFLSAAGKLTGEQAVDVVLKQKAAARFIVNKLVRFFVFDEPTPDAALLEPLAVELEANELNLGPTVRRILSSQLFFSEHAIGRKVRSPVELGVGLLSCLDATTNLNALGRDMGEVGQALFYPPNVKGWDGGRTWINSSTLLGRANLSRRLLSHPKTRFAGGSFYELLRAHEVAEPELALNWLVDLLLVRPLPNDVRSRLLDGIGNSNDNETYLKIAFLLTTLPEFQLS